MRRLALLLVLVALLTVFVLQAPALAMWPTWIGDLDACAAAANANWQIPSLNALCAMSAMYDVMHGWGWDWD